MIEKELIFLSSLGWIQSMEWTILMQLNKQNDLTNNCEKKRKSICHNM